jgi:two-component system sensor histidine kinase KdpD
MAARVHAEWIALHVETGADQRLTRDEREDLMRALELAEQLGGRAVTLSGASAGDEILAYARAHNVTRIVLGKTRRPRWRELWRGSLLDVLVRGSGPIELLTISGEDEKDPPPEPAPTLRSPAAEYAAAVGIVTVPTLAGLVIQRAGVTVPPIDAAMAYLLAVVVAAARYRRGPALTASLVGIASFDFFFVHPFYTFSVSDVRYVLTFGVMLVVALVMGNLTGRIRSQAESARDREQRTAALYALSRDLATAADRRAVLAAALRSVRDTFAMPATILLPGEGGALAVAEPPTALEERERAVAQWTFDHAQPAGRGTGTLPASQSLYMPLLSSGKPMGVLGLGATDPADFRDPARRRLLESLAGQTGAALERLALAERSRASEVEIEAERLRTALLSSLSHDMRTPLASIEGAASTLLQETEPGAMARRELASTIVQESHRMGRLVANLLDMIRVESGSLHVHKEWQLLPDVVGVALLRVEDQLRDHPVTTSFPADLPLVPMDEILLEQVFVNLLENAARHTPPGTAIEVGAEPGTGEVIAWVADRGPGIPSGQEEAVFRKFHRAGPAAGGIGLGLTISRGIVTAHGGRIWAEPRPGGGAAFRLSLPISGTPPTLVTEEAPWTALPRSSS